MRERALHGVDRLPPSPQDGLPENDLVYSVFDVANGSRMRGVYRNEPRDRMR